MSLILRSQTANLSASRASFIPAIPDGLEGWFYLDGASRELSARNLVRGKPDATIEGAPTQETSHMRCSLGNSLLTAIPDEGDFTFLAVSKLPTGFNLTGSSAWAVSAYSPGAGLFYRPNGTSPAAGRATNAPLLVGGVSTYTQALGPSLTVATDWAFWGGTFEEGVGFKVYDRTNNTFVATANTTPRVAAVDSLYRIGASTLTGLPIDLSFIGIWTRALPLGEIDPVHSKVRAYLGRRHLMTV